MRFVILFLLAFSWSFCQSQEVLFSVNKTSVTAKEFKRVYNKNIDLVKDEKQKDIDEYLNLYVNYKLKLEEAYSLGLDDKKEYKRELQSYRKQLSKKYLTDTEVSEKLLTEAYYRTLNEVNVNHILVKVSEEAEPSDTLKAYNKVLEYRNQALKEGFEVVMKKVDDGSRSPGKTTFGEKLGYFNAFRMVYPFENASYATEIGEVSMPFRTKFGYHIVKVLDKRKSQGEVTVAHVMIANNNKTLTGTPKERIDEIYKQLQEGAVFENLARQFSDDKNSAKNGGKLTRFGAGKLNAKSFEDAAFALDSEGELSQPIQTEYGWHIIKLIKKHDVPSFDELKGELERKIAKDSRSKFLNDKFYESLKKRYKLTIETQAKKIIAETVDENFLKGVFEANNSDYRETMATYANQKITYLNYYNYLRPRIRRYRGINNSSEIIKRSLTDFLNETIFTYHDANLENEFEDFAAIMQEYKEGLLLFELMEQEIWNKSKTDTLGLQKYFASNKEKYFWKERIDAVIVSAKNKTLAKKASKLLKSGANVKEIKEKLNNEVLISEGMFEKESNQLPSKYSFSIGTSKVIKNNGQFIIVQGKEVLKPSQMKLEEVRGRVINDYQTQLEFNWLADLKNKYAVEVDQEVLQKVKSQLVK